MDTYAKNYKDWWEGVFKEESAKLDKLDAEQRMEHNKVLDDFSAEASAAADWAEADWEQFKARVQQWTSGAQMKVDETL
ncbi:MAG: hypothetical protein KA066_00950 [Candidatus Pacebacteria bacterium]|nr:hypothetical protein [Candidatus Paceibacterota bacterium]